MNTMREAQKISIPVPPATILHRANLVQTLVNAIEPRDSGWSSPYQLVLLCAPAGYGKTTLLADTAQRLAGTCCWYTLDQSDTDPALFLRRLCASIRRGFPTFGEHILTLFEEDMLTVENDAAELDKLAAIGDRLITALKSEITQPLVLIFCNYHEVNEEKQINRFVDQVITNLASRGTVVIESQAMPDLTLAPLIARRQMFGMGNQGLRFSAQEVYELALLQGGSAFPFAEAEQLAQQFDGWIAGILLGSRLGYASFQQTMFSPHVEQWGESARENQRQILAYVANEVFKRESATYELLEKTAILARLNPAHCNALLEIRDAAERLAYAERRGLFLARDRENTNAGEARDYICHPVLRQIFSESLRQQFPEEHQRLHGRAALILQADRQHSQALMHAYEAREYDLAARIIIEGAPTIVYEEHSEMILHWLEQLPQEIFNQYPQLLLIASNIHLRHGEFALVPPLLDTADSLLPLSAEKLDRGTNELLQAELAIARGHLFFFQGEFKRTQELCQQALALLPPDEHLLHIRAYQYLGISLIVGQGQIQEGITQLQSALQMSRSERNERQAATIHRLIANAYSWIANHALAEYHQMRAFQIWEKLNNTQGIIYGLTSMGLLKMRQGLAQEAEELLRRAIQLSVEPPPFKSGEAYALVGLGDLYNNLGKYAEALNFLEDSLNLARMCDDHYLVSCSLCSLALTYLFLGDAQTAHFFLNQVVLKDGGKQSFEGCLFLLTQGTVYLAQQRYEQAEKALIQASETSRRSSIQIIYIGALQRLVICYLRQNKKQAAHQLGQQIIDLNKKGDFDFLLEVEVRRYHELAAFLAQVPGMVSLPEEVSPPETVTPELPGPLEKIVEKIEGVQDRQSEPVFQVLALGEPQVIPNGVPVTHWRMARSLELFFFLLEKRKPVRKEQITMALWPEHDGEQTDSTVRTMIYYLRRALGKNIIVSQSGLYSLDTTAWGKDKLWYDVDIFNAQHMQAKKALEAQDDDMAKVALTRMVNLYNGDYVQPFYNDWCIPRRDKLRQAYMDAHHQLARIAWRREEWDDSLLHWQRLVALDVCYEAAHYGIMRCYLQQGKRELALRQFQSCSQILQEELSTPPKASLQKLYRSIIGQTS